MIRLLTSLLLTLQLALAPMAQAMQSHAPVPAGVNASTLGIGFGEGAHVGLLGFGDDLTLAALVERGIDATLTSGLSAAVHGTDFGAGLTQALGHSVLTLALADTQTLIGDQGLVEGSFPHAALHALAGCGFAEAMGAACAAGAASGLAQSVYAGTLVGTDIDRDRALDQAELIGALAGYAFSSGDARNVSAGANTARSGLKNNYLYHLEAVALEQAREALAACQAGGACAQDRLTELQATIAHLEALDTRRDAALRAACDADPTGTACTAAITDALMAVEYYADPASVLAGPQLGGYGLLEMYLQNGLDGHERAAHVEAVYDHREAALALLAAYAPSVAHTQHQLGMSNMLIAGVPLAAIAGGEALALCVASPACSFAMAGVELTDCALNPSPLCLTPGPSPGIGAGKTPNEVINDIAAAVRPQVVDTKLGNLVDNVYKGASNPNRVGDGSLGDAVRHELLTGGQVHGRSHVIKAQETIKGLENWIENTPYALAVDREVALDIIGDLQNALKGMP